MTDSPKPGEPCWIDLLVPDADAAAKFYGDLFGWTAGEASDDFGGYRMFFRGDQPIAGLMPNDAASGSPNAWNVYLASDDAAATVQRAGAAGAQVVVEPMPIADLGRMAMLVDPTGAAIGVWQAGSFPGFLTRTEDASPVWFETLTNDYERSVAFYTDAFGWTTSTMSDTPEFRYTTLGEDRDARAGILDAAGLLGDQPSRWQFYVQVPDTDATVEKALAAGGTQVQPTEDTPYGRIAPLLDPAGVPFHVMGPNLGRAD
jgi:uncharacterized protein